jgi:hypothetical protein
MTDSQTRADQAVRRAKHTEILRERLDVAGRSALDIGCGDGALVRFLARQGAFAIGLEVTRGQLARALEAGPQAGARFLVSRGEALPFADRALDLAVLFNSLHHLPAADFDLALAEAARVLREGGLLYVMEPLAEGPFYDLVRTVEDETEIRAAAYAAIGRAEGASFEPIEELIYEAPIELADFAAFKKRVVAVDPARRAAFEAHEPALETGFHAAAERYDGGFRFWQPSRLNLLRRA